MGDAVGTPYWMAPEIIELSGATTASDIWSVGATVIELLTGSPPYMELDAMPVCGSLKRKKGERERIQALFRIVSDDHPPLPEGITPACKDFLMQCFQKDPTLRISAERLLKHRWLKSARKKAAKTSDPVGNVGKKGTRRSKEKTHRYPPTWATWRMCEGILSKLKPSKKKRWPIDDVRVKKQSVERKENAVSVQGLAPMRELEKKKRSKSHHPQRKVVEVEDAENWDDFGEEPALGNKALLQLPPGAREAMEDDGDWGDDFEESSHSLSGPKAALNSPSDVMARFREDEDEGFDDLGKGVPAKLSLNKFQEKEEEEDWGDLGGGESGGMLKLQTSALPSAVDEEDPFADILIEEDEGVDFEENVMRDKIAQLTTQMMRLIDGLVPNALAETSISTCKSLVELIKNNPDLKPVLISEHGVIPIMEMLETENHAVLLEVLRVVNAMVDKSSEVQENLCLVGGIPAIIRFGKADYAKEIRMEVASFVLQMCKSSTLTLQMFIACRGLPTLVQCLEPDYATYKDLAVIAVDGIWSVFRLQTATPKNDFCRIFAKSGLLPRIAQAFASFSRDNEEYALRLAQIMAFFSNAESKVRQMMASTDCMGTLLKVSSKLSPPLLVHLLKVIKNLSMDSSTLSLLAGCGVFKKLVEFMGRRSGAMVNEMHNQILNALYNLCRIDRERQEMAARAGAVPHLQHFIKTNSPLKEFAIPVVCDIVHAGPDARKALHECDGEQFYYTLLKQTNWQFSALDSLATWCVEDRKMVEPVLLRGENVKALVEVFQDAQANVEKLLDPFILLLTHSKALNQALSNAGFVTAVLVRRKHPRARVRVNLLKALTLLYKAHDSPKRMIAEFKLFPIVQKMAEEDKAVMVQTLASSLVRAFRENIVM